VKGVFVGLTTLDLIQYVDSFPEPDTKIQALDRWMGAGGPAANAAVTFAALGGEAELVTAIGSSPAAEIAHRDLEANSVTVRDLAEEGELAISNIVVDRGGRRTVVSMNAAGFGGVSAQGSLAGDAVLVLSDGHHVGAALPILDQARDRGCPTVFDGGSRKPGTEDLLARSEYVIASSSFAPGQPAEQFARQLQAPPVRMAAVSRGEEPIVGVADGTPFEIAIQKRDVVDTLGAGDVLHGAFAYYLSTGEDPVPALARAADVASEACAARGPRLSPR
jgi:sugar/nucleoside kinase (ribokinase family)